MQKKSIFLFQLELHKSIRFKTCKNHHKCRFLEYEFSIFSILLRLLTNTINNFLYFWHLTNYLYDLRNLLYQKLARFYKNWEVFCGVSCSLKIILNIIQCHSNRTNLGSLLNHALYRFSVKEFKFKYDWNISRWLQRLISKISVISHPNTNMTLQNRTSSHNNLLISQFLVLRLAI